MMKIYCDNGVSTHSLDHFCNVRRWNGRVRARRGALRGPKGVAKKRKNYGNPFGARASQSRYHEEQLDQTVVDTMTASTRARYGDWLDDVAVHTSHILVNLD